MSAQQPLWAEHRGERNNIVTARTVSRPTFPKNFKLFDLNGELFRQQLLAIVDRQRSTIISMPNADGYLEQFEIFEASNFEKELQDSFPEIRAFSGRGLTDRHATLKLSYSPQGIQGTVFRVAKGIFSTGGETEIIEPYSADSRVYAVFKSIRNKGGLPWACSTSEKAMFSEWSSQIREANLPDSSEGKIRAMRLAQSCNGEYANFFGADEPSEVGLVLAAFNNTFTRANGVYEKDLGVHLDMIAESVNIIFYNPATDPYSTTLSEWNNQVRDAIRLNGIAIDEYDIGHMFGASGGGGNAGCIGCVCSNNPASTHFGHDKGRGITSPADGNPQGDFFDIDYVVHEVGHQLGANHTFSLGALPVPEGYGQDKEVGSGITIMGYAGITEADVAPHSIDAFHETSIGQIQTNLPTRPCPAEGIITMTANSKPVVAPVSDYTIPILTPFKLTGSATDPEGDPLTYHWEQNDSAMDTGPLNFSANAAKAVGPNWISWNPTTSPTRLFPRLETILAGQLLTDEHPNGSDPTVDIEALSAITRTLNFRLTVRDSRPYVAGSTIGQTEFTDTVVSVTNTAGPFKVTAPDTMPPTWPGGTMQTVSWLTAGTNVGLVNTPTVNILLSTDAGQTFPFILASGTPNDGSESVLIPSNAVSTTARVMVEAVGNIFFDIGDANFTINSPTAAPAALSGRITDSTGNGLSRAVLTVVSSQGSTYTAITSAFGYFRFEALPTGMTYVVTPTHKRATFSPASVVYDHSTEFGELNFTAQ